MEGTRSIPPEIVFNTTPWQELVVVQSEIGTSNARPRLSEKT